MTAPSRIPPRALALLAVLTLVWGTNWPLFPLATREVSVWTFRAVAVVAAGLALLAVGRARGLPLAIPRANWPVLAVASLFNMVIWNIATAYAAILIPSGQAAILGFTMPFWLALVGWAVLGHRPDRRMGISIALGAAGVGLLMVDATDAYAKAPLGFALGLLAGLGWAVGTLLLKRNPLPVPAVVAGGWMLLLSALPIVAGALALGSGPWFVPSWTSLAVIAYIALVPMGIGNAAWLSIVGMLPAQLAAVASILVPIVAMVAGALVHGEPLGPLQWAAMACSVAGLSLALLTPAVARP